MANLRATASVTNSDRYDNLVPAYVLVEKRRQREERQEVGLRDHPRPGRHRAGGRNIVKPDPCPICGVNLALVGRAHRCLPQQVATIPVAAAPSRPSRPAASDRTNGTNHHQDGERSKDAEHKASQRAANPDAYRTYQRDLMRRLRAEQRAASPA